MNADVCGVGYPPSFPEGAPPPPLYRCGIDAGHEGDHRDWGVLETPGEITSWVFTWETEGEGS